LDLRLAARGHDKEGSMLQAHPRIAEYGRSISSRTKYPIGDLRQLIEALGGDDTVIDFEGRKTVAKQLREAIPDSFFPVESEEDLLKKSEELRAKYLGNIKR